MSLRAIPVIHAYKRLSPHAAADISDEGDDCDVHCNLDMWEELSELATLDGGDPRAVVVCALKLLLQVREGEQRGETLVLVDSTEAITFRIAA